MQEFKLRPFQEFVCVCGQEGRKFLPESGSKGRAHDSQQGWEESRPVVSREEVSGRLF